MKFEGYVRFQVCVRFEVYVRFEGHLCVGGLIFESMCYVIEPWPS